MERTLYVAATPSEFRTWLKDWTYTKGTSMSLEEQDTPKRGMAVFSTIASFWIFRIYPWGRDGSIQARKLQTGGLSVTISYEGPDPQPWADLAQAVADRWPARDIVSPIVTHKDSGHYSYGLETRRKIVEQYRQEREAGRALNKNAWAKNNWGITGKTLLSYEREFPE